MHASKEQARAARRAMERIREFIIEERADAINHELTLLNSFLTLLEQKLPSEERLKSTDSCKSNEHHRSEDQLNKRASRMPLPP